MSTFLKDNDGAAPRSQSPAVVYKLDDNADGVAQRHKSYSTFASSSHEEKASEWQSRPDTGSEMKVTFDGIPTRMCSARVVSAIISAFAVKAVVIGLYFSFGSLLPSLLGAFDSRESTTVLIGSLAEATFNVGCLVAGRSVERHGPVVGFAVGVGCFCGGLLGDGLVGSLRGLMITHSLVGVGMAFTDMSIMSFLHRHTPVNVRGTCVGIACVGAGLGLSVDSWLISSGVAALGLWNTFLAAAASSAVLFSIVLTVMHYLEKDLPPAAASDIQKELGQFVSPRRQWVLNQKYVIFFLGLAFYAVGVTVPYNLIKVIALDRGLTSTEAGVIPIAMGISESMALVIFGALGDRCGSYWKTFILTVLGGTSALVFLPSCTGISSFVIFGILYSTSSGGRAGLLSLVCLELAGNGFLMSVYGAACSVFVLSSVGTPLVGAVYDQSGSYAYGIYFIAGTTALSLVCFIAVYFLSGGQVRSSTS